MENDFLPLHDEDLENDNVGVLDQIQSTDGEHVVELCRRIATDHVALEIDGTVVDVLTARAVVMLADSLNPKNRASFIARRCVVKMGRIAQKLVF